MKKIILIVLVTGAFSLLKAQQETTIGPPRPAVNLGLGVGIDYGGFGGRLTYLVSDRIGFFGALGYNLLGAGVNAGGIVRLIPESKICPYLGLMYGYNAVIKITGAEEYNQTYYGLSIPIGIEFWPEKRRNYFNIELVVPVRPSEFKSDLDEIKANPGIEMKSEPLPVSFSIGFHIGL